MNWTELIMVASTSLIGGFAIGLLVIVSTQHYDNKNKRR